MDGEWRDDRPFIIIIMVLRILSDEDSADKLLQARFQVRKTLAAAKAA